LYLSPQQIPTAQKLIAVLGLTNITLKTGDLMEVGADLGHFDYLIAYGVYSWGPVAVRD
jgi:hypothetical protein